MAARNMSPVRGVAGGIAALVWSAVLACSASAQDVVINEYWAHDFGSPLVEYIELYSATGVDLGGLSVIVVDGNNKNDSRTYNFRRLAVQVDFPQGTTIPPDGYYLIGSNLTDPPPDRTIPANKIPNGTITIAIVRTQDIQDCTNGHCDHEDEGELSPGSIDVITANLIDGIAIRDQDANDPVYFNAPVLPPTPTGTCWDSGARMPNGVDTDSADDFQVQNNAGMGFNSPYNALSTPGQRNDTVRGACCLPGGACEILPPTDCIERSGTYAGTGSLCTQVICSTHTGGPGPTGCAMCDVDGEEGVDVFDLLAFLDCWFEGCP